MQSLLAVPFVFHRLWSNSLTVNVRVKSILDPSKPQFVCCRKGELVILTHHWVGRGMMLMLMLMMVGGVI